MNKDFKELVIAVDGYSSTGKSTLAKIVAARLGLVYIDTGAMYRAVTLKALREGVVVGGGVDRKRLKKYLQDISIELKYNVASGKSETYLNDENVENQIRGMEVSNSVSQIAAIDFVREFLVEKQREMGEKGGVIMDGRDIGSVVFPDADVKFFLTTSLDVRAMRRYKELAEKGDPVSYEEVRENVRQRDYIDTHREIGPLKQTDDAILLDNSDMGIEEGVQFMLRHIKAVKGEMQ